MRTSRRRPKISIEPPILPADPAEGISLVQNRARFLREPKAAARLRHPNIVPIYDAGHFYIAAAFIAGQTLK